MPPEKGIDSGKEARKVKYWIFVRNDPSGNCTHSGKTSTISGECSYWIEAAHKAPVVTFPNYT
jgi:hypothetical protein